MKVKENKETVMFEKVKEKLREEAREYNRYNTSSYTTFPKEFHPLTALGNPNVAPYEMVIGTEIQGVSRNSLGTSKDIRTYFKRGCYYYAIANFKGAKAYKIDLKSFLGVDELPSRRANHWVKHFLNNLLPGDKGTVQQMFY